MVQSLQLAEIITGERLQQLCDVTVTCHPVNQFHTSLPSTCKRVFLEEPGTWDVLNQSKVIFCYTHLLPIFEKVILKRITHPFVLMTHNSDDVITEQFSKILEYPFLIHWFGQSCMIKHPKLTAIPIGVANAQWPHGNLDVLVKCANENFKKNVKNLYINFNVNTNIGKRSLVLERLQKAGYRNAAPMTNQYDYYKMMAAYQYVACPEGNSPDCHRVYEALYLDCIPVVQNSDFYSALKVCHVHVPLDQLEHLDPKKDLSLPILLGDKSILNMSYWKSQIQNFKDQI